MVFTVATDLFPSRMVGSVSGFGGFVAGMVSIAAAESIGRVLDADATLYQPIFIAAGLIYPLALGVFHVLSPRMEPVPDERR
jgi:ACS family hexuronate transporter-like MFS transporter